MTLRELAADMRKLVKFNYMTVENYRSSIAIIMWIAKPTFKHSFWSGIKNQSEVILLALRDFELVPDLDLSEYEDEYGNIDYSKCIVEV